ncbi:hypothetical protein FJTKL_04067 [Diaporthe vaccinii]|uniref:Uncharacterized protein n=1 Tax=Diaporthe vaccinii TaxID=105482 RepID=A0ABR4DUI0_9PEZI
MVKKLQGCLLNDHNMRLPASQRLSHCSWGRAVLTYVSHPTWRASAWVEPYLKCPKRHGLSRFLVTPTKQEPLSI